MISENGTMEESPVTCNSKQDIVVLVDGSASLSPAAFEGSKEFVHKFVTGYDEGAAEFSFILFSGPRKWKEYDECAKNVSVELTDEILKDVCGLNLIQPLSNDTAATLANLDKMEQPGKTTFTSGALLLAKNVLAFARPEAEKVVVLVTDGKPIDKEKTQAAAKEVRQAGIRIVVAPIEGFGLEEEHLQGLYKLASWHRDDNFVDIKTTEDDLHLLTEISTVNTLVEDVCGINTRFGRKKKNSGEILEGLGM
jgi:hypothetical protein